MEKSEIKTISLVCPSCGGKMEYQEGDEKATCPYCGHIMLIDKDEPSEEYERRMASACAEEDIKDLQKKRQRVRTAKGWLIALGVLLVIILLSVLIPGSPVRKLFFPDKVDPFKDVSVKFSGMSGTAKAELQFANSDAEWANAKTFTVTPATGLKNGDMVTVKAKAIPGLRFEPSEKKFTVEGLTEWVTETDQISEENLAIIHANTERLIKEDWNEIVSSEYATGITYTPYKLYLFITDGPLSFEYNVLYDTYEVKVTRADGSVFTSYEAARYSDLKIPPDGVMTAYFEDLQGFNFGYKQGFSYAHSFSGWTDAAAMDADLRHARDGFHLVD